MNGMTGAVRLAAENCYAVAQHYDASKPEAYPGQHENLTKLVMERNVADAIGPSPERTLDLLYDDGVRELEHIRLGYFDPMELDRDDKLTALRRLCERKIEQIDAMLSHRCEFSDDDYCVVCGLDGRA